ncbi:hypothetical protein F4780DRAFT_777121 [Xylariomycetidae sp. FL0641]|nr:hypothetical protein F4780DRAFT_777121 [Xylariomycetidae sp. FL0641]
MASTRASTGNSRPRVHLGVSTAPERKRKAATSSTGSSTKRRGRPASTTSKTTTTKANTGAGVKKRGRPSAAAAAAATKTGTHHKRKPHLSDKVAGAAEKAVGTVTGRPGKKAAGTRRMRGTDGKGARGRPRKT